MKIKRFNSRFQPYMSHYSAMIFFFIFSNFNLLAASTDCTTSSNLVDISDSSDEIRRSLLETKNFFRHFWGEGDISFFGFHESRFPWRKFVIWCFRFRFYISGSARYSRQALNVCSIRIFPSDTDVYWTKSAWVKVWLAMNCSRI